jgi:aspartate 1-decarboxylase
MAFAELEADEIERHQPRVVALDQENRIVERLDYPPVAQPGEGLALLDR